MTKTIMLVAMALLSILVPTFMLSVVVKFQLHLASATPGSGYSYTWVCPISDSVPDVSCGPQGEAIIELFQVTEVPLTDLFLDVMVKSMAFPMWPCR